MFIWTISDAIGLGLLALGALFFGPLFLIIWFQDWRMKRRRRNRT
jgi:hypothetical protein